jgi:hypothetical protein
MEGNGNPENFGIKSGQIIPPWIPSLYLGGPSEFRSKHTASAEYGDSKTSLDLSQSLRQFRIELRRVGTVKAKQTLLDKWFSSTESHNM